jgi:hypothetical protein
MERDGMRRRKRLAALGRTAAAPAANTGTRTAAEHGLDDRGQSARHLPAAVTSCDCGLRCDSRIAIGQMMMHTTSERMAIAVGSTGRGAWCDNGDHDVGLIVAITSLIDSASPSGG